MFFLCLHTDQCRHSTPTIVIEASVFASKISFVPSRNQSSNVSSLGHQLGLLGVLSLFGLFYGGITGYTARNPHSLKCSMVGLRIR